MSQKVDALLLQQAKKNTWRASAVCSTYEQVIYRYQAAQQLIAKALEKYPTLFEEIDETRSCSTDSKKGQVVKTKIQNKL